MKAAGMRPDTYTCSFLMNGALEGSGKEALFKKALSEMAQGLGTKGSFGQSSNDSNGKDGVGEKIDEASRDSAFQTRLTSAAASKDFELVMKILEEMKEAGSKVQYVLFTVFI